MVGTKATNPLYAWVFLLAASVAGTSPAISPQNDFRVVSYTVDGGPANASTGNGFRVRGSIGQPDAGVMFGAGYRLQGGFWTPESSPLGDALFNDRFEAESSSARPDKLQPETTVEPKGHQE